MSEGDSIHWLARRLSAVLQGEAPEQILAPHPRTRTRGFKDRLAGRPIVEIGARGKHLLVRFHGGLVLHSHLGMTGAWRVHERGSTFHRSPRAAWLGLRTGQWEVLQFGGPTLELLTSARARTHPRLAALGPDICAPGFDPAKALARLRSDDPSRGIGDALLDQRSLAGIGNLWKVEACWLARIDPWRPLARVRDDEILSILAEARPRMVDSATTGRQWRYKRIYGTSGRPCPRCGARIQVRRQGDAARPTWWCPECQH